MSCSAASSVDGDAKGRAADLKPDETLNVVIVRTGALALGLCRRAAEVGATSLRVTLASRRRARAGAEAAALEGAPVLPIAEALEALSGPEDVVILAVLCGAYAREQPRSAAQPCEPRTAPCDCRAA